MTANHFRKAPDIEKFRKMLKDRGLKATPQRLAVHEAMLALVHASVDQVVDYIVENSSTRVTVTSVYNVLSGLADAGIYSRRLSSNNKMYFDVNTPGRYSTHLYDTSSNSYIDFDDEHLRALVETHLKGMKFSGYKIDGVDIQLVCHPTGRRKKK